MKENKNNIGTILIVDDLPDNLRVLSRILTKRGYEVKKVTNGKTAIRASQLDPPDLILLDIRMPEMDGYEVCRQLKANQETEAIPILFISALDETLDKVRAFQVGGVDYICKPFEVEEVIARIESQLTIQRQRKQLQKEIENRQQAEEILRQSRAFLSSILNSALDGIAAVQAMRQNTTGEIIDFRCLAVNPVIARFFGKPQSNLIGKLGVKKFITNVDPKLFSALVNVVETGESLAEDVYYEYNSLKYWFHFIAVKLGDGFSITVRNITERKEMELELTQSNKDLQTFSYSLSHDLRNYISHITIASSLLKEEESPELGENIRDLINIIYDSGQKTSQILEGIMELSCVKDKDVIPDYFNLSELVEKTLSYLQITQAEREAQIIIEPNVMVMGDPKLLQIMMENLLNNAWKFTAKEVEAVIEFGVIKKQDDLWQEVIDRANITLLDNIQQDIYFVKDNGVGFDMNKYEQLFTPFQCLDSKKDFDGTGIGLSIVQRIIERHDGFIWAESEVGKGATFYFIIS